MHPVSTCVGEGPQVGLHPAGQDLHLGSEQQDRRGHDGGDEGDDREPVGRVEQRDDDEDDAEADSIFTILMGDEVDPRRQFIQSNALEVKNLDV